MIEREGNDGKIYRDFPFDEICKRVERLAAEGHRCYQKFSCENCGQRLGMDRANVMYTQGSCDRCGHITDIKKNGCNYMLISMLGKEPR